jgi:Tol biopolymer transport system component
MTMTATPTRRPTSDRPFWLTAIGLLVTLALLTLLVVVRGSTVGVGVTTAPEAGATVSGRARIILTFDAAMDTTSVESRLRLDPAVEGHWSWESGGARSDRVAQFIPTGLLNPGATYTATLAPGARAQNGRAVARETTWHFTVRTGQLLFLKAGTVGAEQVRNLWSASPDGTDQRQITSEPGGVLEYSPAPDGSRIAYTTQEAGGATALWAINADGTGRTRLSPANDPSLYSTPAWSPAGDIILYVLRSALGQGSASGTTPADNTPGQTTFGASKLWGVAPDGRSLGRIYGRGDEVGFAPVWSPDGTHLAFRGPVDNNNRGSVVISDLSGNPIVLPAAAGSTITWSPDNHRLAYDEIVPDASGTAQSRIVIVGADGKSATAFSGVSTTNAAQPAWSPDGARIAFTRQVMDHGIATTELWVANPDGTDAVRIFGGDGLAAMSPVWSPDGKALIATRSNPVNGQAAGIWRADADGSDARALIPLGDSEMWLP